MTKTNRKTAVYRVDTEAAGFFCIIATSPYRAALCVKRAGHTVTCVTKIQD